MSKALTYVELDIPVCTRTYGVAPCTASVGVTGPIKCFNTRKTCQDIPHYAESTVTLRFGIESAYRPKDIDCIPCLRDEPDHSPGRVSLGENLGERSVLTVTLKDHKHSDTGQGFDKYLADRGYDPYEQGTFFGKFRARQPFLGGQAALRWYQGFLGQSLPEMEVRHFVVESFDGPTPDGRFTFVAKDPLKRLDGDRALFPRTSKGYLAADITAADTVCTLLPAGIGDAEYDPAGHATIGGNETVAYVRDVYAAAGYPATVLLLHCDGTVGQTAFTDSSPVGRSVSRGGNAQLVDTQTIFGPTVLRLQASSGDFVSVAAAGDLDLGTGNFTIDGRFYFNTLNGGHLFSQASGGSVGHRLIVNADGSLDYAIQNTTTLLQLLTAAGAVATGQKYHITVERSGNVWTLYVNGVVKAQTTQSLTVPSFAAAFRVGAGNGGNNVMNGFCDEFRFTKVATWNGAAFTPLACAYQVSGDVLTITRAQLGSEASTHSTQDRVQKVGRFVSRKASDIIEILERDYAGVPQAFIPKADWTQEDNSYLGTLYSADVVEPTPVKQLVEELLEQTGSAHWWDEPAQLLRWQVIREVLSDTHRYTERNRIAGSLQVKDQPDKRISRVQIYYGLADPTKGIDNDDNFRSVFEKADAEAEADYGSQAIKVIKSRWIAQFGSSQAERLADILLARYRDPPRSFGFEVMRSDDEPLPVLGGGYQTAAHFLQDETGAPKDSPIQLTRLKAGPAVISVEAEEMLFANSVSADPNYHIITLSSNTNNFNLRAAHDVVYGTPVAGQTIECIINSGVFIGSASTAQYSFDTGDWPAGVTLKGRNKGRIQGASGNGGRPGAVEWKSIGGGLLSNENTAAEAGGAGGPALKVRYPLELLGNGAVLGGGGGGGGGGANLPSEHYAGRNSVGGGGGGGRGKEPGVGGLKRSNGQSGGPGTSEAAGTGGAGGGDTKGKRGGDGGGAGAAGSAGVNGSVVAGGLGGAAGNAIEGNSFVTETGTVTITGPRI